MGKSIAMHAQLGNRKRKARHWRAYPARKDSSKMLRDNQRVCRVTQGHLSCRLGLTPVKRAMQVNTRIFQASRSARHARSARTALLVQISARIALRVPTVLLKDKAVASCA